MFLSSPRQQFVFANIILNKDIKNRGIREQKGEPCLWAKVLCAQYEGEPECYSGSEKDLSFLHCIFPSTLAFCFNFFIFLKKQQRIVNN